MSWSDIFVRDSQQTAEEGDAHYQQQLADYNARLARREGTFAPDHVYSDLGPIFDQNAAAWQGAAEGAAQGWRNVLNAPGQAVGTVGSWSGSLLGGVLKNVPWWVWIAAAAGLFVWMGGLSLLQGRLARR